MSLQRLDFISPIQYSADYVFTIEGACIAVFFIHIARYIARTRIRFVFAFQTFKISFLNVYRPTFHSLARDSRLTWKRGRERLEDTEVRFYPFNWCRAILPHYPHPEHQSVVRSSSVA